ncbi:MAG: TonB-dependent receptor [Thermoanaerobaculia bacterium]|nr:TonB-dependent receptor [Thermoanaerobaculia bacterium]
MRKRTTVTMLVLLAVFLAASPALWAQGVQTATLIGTVMDSEGNALPGVTVRATSAALQGERSTVSGVNGDYIIRGLPPGSYRVVFSLEGMTSVERVVALGLGTPTRADALMQLAATEETILVTGESASALETTTVGANFTSATIETLPTGRTPAAIAALAGGVNDSNTPVAGQVQINGGMAYDNAILINGVNVQDPIFGQSNNLFIEDAIAETQVLTSGISAEYGQFTGGVVNVVTRSGGNKFSGSFRTDLSKPTWRNETPFEKERGLERTGDLSKIYSATFGGPVVRDRLWFFLAGRDAEVTTDTSLAVTGQSAGVIETNERYEVKLTGTLGGNHTVQGSYSDNPVERNLEIQVAPIELAAIGRNSKRENYGWVVGYSGILTPSLFAEARYSEKVFGFRGLGGTSTRIQDSPMRGVALLPGTNAGTFNAPYFDATDPEDRNNEQLYGSLSWFLSSETWGSHDLKAGAERFTVIRTGGNSQSASGYVFLTDYKAVGGQPVYDANGRLIPVFTNSPVGGTSFTRLQNWIATRGAELDITTDSYFVNDRWNLNKNWSFNIGLRYEQTRSDATGGITGVDTDTLTPRLGISFDPRGDGKFKFDATYAEYGGRYNPSIIGRNTPVGNPAQILYQYVGPTGEGVDFAPAFDLNNYVVTGISVPGKNLFFEDGLSAPVNEEITLSAAMSFERGSYLKLTYIDRELTELIDDFILYEYGTTTVELAGRSIVSDNTLYKNTNAPKRTYQGAQLQGRYRITDAWTVEGAWTHQFENDGNYEGEGGQTIGATVFGDRPELQSPRNNPMGRFDDYQRDRVRLWSTYALDFGRFGNMSASLLYRYDSPLTFSYSTTVALSSIQRSRDPGYRQPPASQTLFFGERGAGEYNSTSLFDLSLTYRIPVWKSLEPWIKFDVFNLFDDDSLRTFNTVVAVDNTSPLDGDGLRTGYTKGVNFGKATAASNYVVPREYLVALGIRF